RRAALLVDVAVTPPAGLAGQEEIGGDDASNVRISGRWEEWARRAPSLLIHTDTHDSWIDDAVRTAQPGVASGPRNRRADRGNKNHHERNTDGPCDALRRIMRDLSPEVSGQ